MGCSCGTVREVAVHDCWHFPATDAPFNASLGNVRPVTSYSGGWKMKMQLCAAQLMNADVPGLDSLVFAYSAPSLSSTRPPPFLLLLFTSSFRQGVRTDWPCIMNVAEVLMLDEPTGHLDVDNIKCLAAHRVKCLAIECTAHQVAGRLAGVLRWQHHLHLPFQPIPRQDVHPGGRPNVSESVLLQASVFRAQPCSHARHSHHRFPGPEVEDLQGREGPDPHPASWPSVGAWRWGAQGKRNESCGPRFVEKYPEKKSYFEIRNDNMRFVFPEPGALEGVKSRSKVILRMNNVSFTYPTKDKPTIMDVSLSLA